MLNKLTAFLKEYQMIQPGDRVTCAVSGGADSIALLFALYLLKEKLQITLCAAHFNHRLRGEESDRDEAFVREFCDRYDIPLHVDGGEVKPGKKGLEAAARDARYAFLKTLDGKIATAHTADDNAETVLLHLVRGTGLKGLGGITPKSDHLIRPMLSCTRQDVESFCGEWCLSYITDSSNDTDDFLRNRLRHHVMPLLKGENPRFAENTSAMAMRLRMDESCLSERAAEQPMGVEQLKRLHPAVRSRALERFLKQNGVREPEGIHIAQLEGLLYSQKPSARVSFPGGVTIARRYDTLEVLASDAPFEPVPLACPGEICVDGFRVRCFSATEIMNSTDTFTVLPRGEILLRSRESGDSMRLSSGSKSLKKLFIDRKIPAAQRPRIPVVADEMGVLGVWSIGVNHDRTASALPAVQIQIEKL